MTSRTVRRAAAVIAGASVSVLLAATPALALDDGEVPGDQPLGDWLLQFVVGPIGLFLVISALVVLPGLLRRPRYRPGRPWKHDPLWFAGPTDAQAALGRVRAGATGKGGARAEW